MFSIGDFVQIKNTSLFGVVVGFTSVFDVCQHLQQMVIVSLTNSTKTELFEEDSLIKILSE